MHVFTAVHALWLWSIHFGSAADFENLTWWFRRLVVALFKPQSPSHRHWPWKTITTFLPWFLACFCLFFNMASGDPLNALLLTLASQAGPSDYAAGSITDENPQPGVISDDEDKIDGIGGIPAAVVDPELDGIGPPPGAASSTSCEAHRGIVSAVETVQKSQSWVRGWAWCIFCKFLCHLLECHPLTHLLHQKANSIEEHMLLLFALTLENRDLLKSMRPEKGWTVSDELAVRPVFIFVSWLSWGLRFHTGQHLNLCNRLSLISNPSVIPWQRRKQTSCMYNALSLWLKLFSYSMARMHYVNLMLPICHWRRSRPRSN